MSKTHYSKSRRLHEMRRSNEGARRKVKERRRERQRLRHYAKRDRQVTIIYGTFGHSSCGRKKRFRSQETAESFLRRHPNKLLSAYKCRLCGGWHITSHPWKCADGGDLSVKEVLDQAREAALEIRRSEEAIAIRREAVGPQGYSMGVHAKNSILDPMRKVDALMDAEELTVDYEALNVPIEEAYVLLAGAEKVVPDPLTIEVATRYYLQAESWSEIVRGNPGLGVTPLSERIEYLRGMSNTRQIKVLQMSLDASVKEWERIGVAHLKEMGSNES